MALGGGIAQAVRGGATANAMRPLYAVQNARRAGVELAIVEAESGAKNLITELGTDLNKIPKNPIGTTSITPQFELQKPKIKAKAEIKGEQLQIPKEKLPKTKGIPEQQITAAGLSNPEALLPHELPKVEKWQKKRNKYLKEHRELDVSGLPEKTQDLLKDTGADRVIRKNMTPDDLAGIFKEERGLEILTYKGEVAKHITEGKQARNAIKNTIVTIKDRLDILKATGQSESLESSLLQDKLSKLSKIKDTYTELMEEAGCQIDPNKLKL